jgi:hypothetical protein
MHKSDRRWRLGCGAITVALLLSAASAAATVTAPELVAAFLFNFARFTEWPADALPAGGPLQLCVGGDSAVAEALERAAKKEKQLGGHPLVVRKVSVDRPVGSCHLLYAAGLDSKRAVALLDAVKHNSVLTLSDLATFPELGGTAQLYFEGDRVRFAVNVESALRFRLRLSSKLLNLAKLVKDDPNVPTR